VHRQTIVETIRELHTLHVPAEIATEREAVLVWAPLYDRVVALFAETVAGPLPTLRSGPDGTPLRTAEGRCIVDGGWPCQRYQDDWRTRAQATLDDYHQQRAVHRLCRKSERASENFAILRTYLEQCVVDPRQLSGRDVGKIRAILAAINTKRGLPGSVQSQELRRAQRVQAARPTPAELAPVLIERLAQLPQDQGLALLDEMLVPITADEAPRFRFAAHQPLPTTLATKLRRCLDAPIAVLVEQGVIPSGEVLARVIPQITADHRAGPRRRDRRRRAAPAV
jgi:hypothetical protein